MFAARPQGRGRTNKGVEWQEDGLPARATGCCCRRVHDRRFGGDVGERRRNSAREESFCELW